MSSFFSGLAAFALAIGGPGLFVIAFLDSSFLSLPLINDTLVVTMVLQATPSWMPYYAAMATGGSVVGCYVIYALADRGGEAFLRRRVSTGRVERALDAYRRWGLLALMVPALLPPPAPFKLFVLLAGVAGVRPLTFVAGIAVARGARYLALGALTVAYGEEAIDLMRTRGQDVATAVAVLILVGVVGWVAWRRYNRRS